MYSAFIAGIIVGFLLCFTVLASIGAKVKKEDDE